jgi:hypothetical protein
MHSEGSQTTPLEAGIDVLFGEPWRLQRVSKLRPLHMNVMAAADKV